MVLKMTKVSTVVAYPTIPIVFLGGINSDRTPLYDTMGLAVTNEAETTRTETTVKFTSDKDQTEIKFLLDKQELTGKRGSQIIDSIEALLSKNNIKGKILIESTNYNIFSGSSDSGLAALFTALNDVFGLDYSKEEILEFSMKGSESAGRSLYGGLTLTKTNEKPLKVIQLASESELSEISLFSVPFHFETRISADEIHAGIVKNPLFIDRVNKIPVWVERIKDALKKKAFLELLKIAEENIQNAHELLEGVKINVRKPDMLKLCEHVRKMREDKIEAYYLIGGGNLVTIATTIDFAKAVAKYLSKYQWKYYEFKVASAPKIIKNQSLKE
jgi:mevalonate-3-kinase